METRRGRDGGRGEAEEPSTGELPTPGDTPRTGTEEAGEDGRGGSTREGGRSGKGRASLGTLLSEAKSSDAEREGPGFAPSWDSARPVPRRRRTAPRTRTALSA